MQCELCGKESKIVPALIEGVELNACPNCAKHGQILKKPNLVKKKARDSAEGPEKIIVKDYSKLIKTKREQLGMTQEEFAKSVNEKLSTMNNIESGNLKPTIALAEKLKRKYGLKLVEELKKAQVKVEKSKTGGFTLGDFIKKK